MIVVDHLRRVPKRTVNAICEWCCRFHERRFTKSGPILPAQKKSIGNENVTAICSVVCSPARIHAW
jgi:hypothetical protein